MSNVIAFRRGKFALGGGRFGQSSSPEDAFIHNAAVDLRFDVGLYRMGKLATTLAAVDALHTRSSGRWVKNGSGIWSFISGSAMAIVPGLGYDGREGFTNFVPDPLFNGAVVGVVGSGGALPTGAFVTHGTLEIVSKAVKADGLTWLRLKHTYVNSLGTIQYPRLRFATGIATVSGQAWRGQMLVNLINASHQTTAMVEGDPYERVASQNLSNGLQEVSIGGTATATPTTMRWQIGPGVNPGETYVAEYEIAAPMLISRGSGMPFGVGAVSTDKIIIPSGPAGMAVDPSATGLTLFWRGRDFDSDTSFPRMIETGIDANNRFCLYRVKAAGSVDVAYVTAGTYRVSSMPLASVPRGVEFSVVATWRADGTCWAKIGAGAPLLRSAAPIFSGTGLSQGIGNSYVGNDFGNQITRRAGFLPMGLSDRAALDLFNQVNEGLAA